MAQQWMVPPHTRGSSHRAIALEAGSHGSPAHAGIVPYLPLSSTAICRFPRTRGDRPRIGRRAPGAPRVPPHTRGSSQARPYLERARRGSPAHAGIVPSAAANCRKASRFPRTRGDRPRRGAGRWLVRWVPPHTRGSSLRCSRACSGLFGSPAHAGIVLHLVSFSRPHPGFPRTRGDRPLTRVDLPLSGQVPPHTRGSSLRILLQ